ncbi:MULTISPECIES: GatB/YqeY domain-containing protein [Shewanella]|uniref:GatB/YqeY domain-containing protein n=2 Tax=Shewanella TaxID=22 RepID=A0A975AL32_9GAMM|nr:MULTISPECIES: GatB/YqeY domain-containing protein [Shewanella]QSX30780.1 GatB/YqeY domain-containing protein [Shewanella cyperi]QSX37997.1 GatB/YqeY domain-containing protein [Shewanella sedimentimangrovi]QSX41558.1 GatB/YqeY domain-containing protein [Shewanella cyperi]
MSLTEQLKDEMKQALVAKDKARLGTIRLALAAIKQIEVDTRETLTDEQVLAVLTKMVKQRRDSIAQYEAAGRSDLAEVEAAEIKVIEAFLPTPLTEEEIASLIDATIAEVGAASIADMGKVMGALKPKVQGRADLGAIGPRIRAKLQ